MSEVIDELAFKWTVEDISKLKPDWDDEKCAKFLGYIKDQLTQAVESAGDNLIDGILGISGD